MESVERCKIIALNCCLGIDRVQFKNKKKYIKGQTASEKMRHLLGASNLLQEQKDLLFAVLNKYGSLTSFQLETLSHSGEPWLEARKGLKDFDHCPTVFRSGFLLQSFAKFKRISTSIPNAINQSGVNIGVKIIDLRY